MGGRTGIAMKLSLAALLLMATGWAAKVAVAEWLEGPSRVSACYGQREVIRTGDPRFRDCLKDRAEVFLERVYPEAKDLAKTFLTLISATLVASITFSEKIVDVHRATLLPMSAMVASWALLLIALGACGAGLALVSAAAGIAVNRPGLMYEAIARTGVMLFLCSGISFVLALTALMTAGVASLIEKRAAAKDEAVT